ncbi:MAG: hypothetical protein GXO33_08025 [Epsilonproteobacteria bacterium]|nr:hypothetical protein [Campylobacterota bacterium]
MMKLKKHLWIAAAAAMLVMGGCAAKSVSTGGSVTQEEGAIVKHVGEYVKPKALKRAIVKGAESDGWMTTPLGERAVIAEKYFDENKNIAVEVIITDDGYRIEYSSAQNISQSKAENLMEDLADAIEKARAEAPENE